MHLSGKRTALYLLFCLLMLTRPQATADASGLSLGRPAGPDGLEIEPAARGSSIGYFYTVQPGDTLWDIAMAHGLTPDDLLPYSQGVDLEVLQPGDTLFVPAAPATVPHRTPTSTPVPSETWPTPAPGGQDGSAAATTSPPVTPAISTPAAPALAADAPAGLAPQLAGWPEAMLKLINEQRAARKIPALTLAPKLALAAQAHAQDCAGRNVGSHVGSDGAVLETRLARVGYVARAASENWANAADVPGTFAAWWNEPPGNDPHRQNILNPRYKEIGIGIAAGGWGYYFIADLGSQ